MPSSFPIAQLSIDNFKITAHSMLAYEIRSKVVFPMVWNFWSWNIKGGKKGDKFWGGVESVKNVSYEFKDL